VAAARTALTAEGLLSYRLEVVVARPVLLPPSPDLVELVVPADYGTRRGSLYKARGLQYALETSQLPPDAWIFHCDEESHVTRSLVRGIAAAVGEEEASGRHRIGQGCVLYHHMLTDHPLLTLADSIRTGDDVGRWHLQNAHVGLPLLGMHGSFVLVRASVEAAVDFDDGPLASITEDAWWALKATEAGHRTRWVDGLLVEQAPESVLDLVRQRQRWMSGLRRTARYAPARRAYRLPLRLLNASWSLAPAALAFTAANLLLGRAAVLYVLQLVLMPVFAALEALGVLAATVRSARSFHVIRKRH